MKMIEGYLNYIKKYDIIVIILESIKELLIIFVLNLRYKITKKIPAVFHSGSIYDYHFIIKELAKELEG